jgi:hypothetical protein
MVAAARSGTVPFGEHLKVCPQCRELFAMMKDLPKKRLQRLEHADPEAVASFAAIPIVVESRRAAARLRGTVRFDSWQELPAANLRDVATAVERRVALEADGVVLELSAERRSGEWEFVGRVYIDGAPTREYVLKAGRRTVAPDRNGYFYFTSSRPPGMLQLLSPAATIAFEKLSWQAAE